MSPKMESHYSVLLAPSSFKTKKTNVSRKARFVPFLFSSLSISSYNYSLTPSSSSRSLSLSSLIIITQFLEREREKTENQQRRTMAAPKADDFAPHPIKDQLPGIDFCLTSPPPWRPYTHSLSLKLSL